VYSSAGSVGVAPPLPLSARPVWCGGGWEIRRGYSVARVGKALLVGNGSWVTNKLQKRRERVGSGHV